MRKLKRHNTEMNVHKEKLNDQKTIKRIRRTNDFNETVEKYQDLAQKMSDLEKI